MAFCILSGKTEGENAMPDMLLRGLTSLSLAPAGKESKHVNKQLGSGSPTTHDNKNESLKCHAGTSVRQQRRCVRTGAVLITVNTMLAA